MIYFCNHILHWDSDLHTKKEDWPTSICDKSVFRKPELWRIWRSIMREFTFWTSLEAESDASHINDFMHSVISDFLFIFHFLTLLFWTPLGCVCGGHVWGGDSTVAEPSGLSTEWSVLWPPGQWGAALLIGWSVWYLLQGLSEGIPGSGFTNRHLYIRHWQHTCPGWQLPHLTSPWKWGKRQQKRTNCYSI